MRSAAAGGVLLQRSGAPTCATLFSNNPGDDEAACTLEAVVRIQNAWDKLQKRAEKGRVQWCRCQMLHVSTSRITSPTWDREQLFSWQFSFRKVLGLEMITR